MNRDNQENYDKIFFNSDSILVNINRIDYGPEKNYTIKNVYITFPNFGYYISFILDNDKMYTKDIHDAFNDWAIKKYWYIFLIISILVVIIIGLGVTIGFIKK